MNKGLRQLGGRILAAIDILERILTWWIKDCDNQEQLQRWACVWKEGENSDLMNKGLRQAAHVRLMGNLFLTWENSDLMNKGLRRDFTLKRISLSEAEPMREFWLDE